MKGKAFRRGWLAAAVLGVCGGSALSGSAPAAQQGFQPALESACGAQPNGDAARRLDLQGTACPKTTDGLAPVRFQNRPLFRPEPKPIRYEPIRWDLTTA